MHIVHFRNILLSVSLQLGNEMKEKYRILENEAEVLTMSAQEKDK